MSVIDWTPIIVAAIGSLITAGAGLMGLIAKMGYDAITKQGQKFEAYLQAQAVYDRQERERAWNTLTEHTEQSRTIAERLFANQHEQTTATKELATQVQRVVERVDRMESRRIG